MMKAVRLLPFSIAILLLSIFIVPVIAADCPEIVKNALDATNSVCSATGRNQACYGNVNLTVEAQADAPPFNFTTPGDLADITGVKKLILSPLDASGNSWGIALLKVQANLPDTLPGQNVSFVLFGDVQIDNAAGATAATLSVSAAQTVNVHEQPSQTAAVASPLQPGFELLADGITEDRAWLRVHAADLSVVGWVSASIVTVSGDVNTLAVVQADAPRYSPMQAFYFKTGVKDAPCSQAPDSGILIQTPEGGGKIALNVDGADITLGSTAYFQAQAGGEMTMSVVEGQGTVTSGGATVTVPAGMRARVPLDANLVANGVPIGPEPYDAAALGVLPLRLLPQAVTIAPALAASAGIAPLPGSWSFGVSNVTAGGGCPEGMGELISAAMIPKTALILPPGPFDPRNLASVNGGKIPDSAVLDHPEPNHYVISFSESGTDMNYDMTIQSPTEIAGTFVFNVEDCEFNMTFSITHVG